MSHASTLALLRYALLALTAGPIGVLVLLGPLVAQATINYVGPLVMLAIAGGGWLLLQRGRTGAAILVLTLGVAGNVTAIAAFTGGVRSPAVVIYPIVILMVGWLMHARAAIRMAALTTVLCVGLWWVEASGRLTAVAAPTASVYLLHLVITFALSAVLVYFVLRAYNQRMLDLQRTSADLAERSTLLQHSTDLLHRAQTVARVGSWTLDVATHRIIPSEQGARLLGIAATARLHFDDFLQHVVPEDRREVAQAWQQALHSGVFEIDHRVAVDGTTRWVRQKAELHFDPEERVLDAVGIVQDITEQMQAQQALAASEARYRTLIEWSPEPMLVHRDGTIVYANPAAVQLFGAPNAQALMRRKTADLIHPDSLAEQTARMRSIYRGERIVQRVASRFLKLDGSVIDVEVQGTAIDFDGTPAIHVAIRDVSERKRMEDQVRQLAFHDTLTQLPNRRLLSDRLEQAVRANRRLGRHGAVMFLDLDNFKPLNDRWGHAVGDLLLIEVASRLKTCVRETDTVSRFGGDEFVVVLNQLDNDAQRARAEATAVAEKIRMRLGEPYALEVRREGARSTQIEHHCSASLGVSLFDGDEVKTDDLLKWADMAMYQAKATGRNRIQFAEAPSAQAGEPTAPGPGA